MPNIFTYGSLMYPEVFDQVAGAPHQRLTATLRDWRRHQLTGQTYPAATPAAGHTIQGVLWLDVGTQALARLDAFETCSYDRQPVQVSTDNGSPINAEIYRWLDLSQLLEQDWSPAQFETLHLKDFFRIYGQAIE